MRVFASILIFLFCSSWIRIQILILHTDPNKDPGGYFILQNRADQASYQIILIKSLHTK